MIVASFCVPLDCGSLLLLWCRQPAAELQSLRLVKVKNGRAQQAVGSKAAARLPQSQGGFSAGSAPVSNARLRCSADSFKLLIAFCDGVGDDLLTGGIKSSIAGRHGLFNLLRTAGTNDCGC